MTQREKATAERRPFQFSLRALLVFVLVASVGAGVSQTLGEEPRKRPQLARFTELGFDAIFGRNGEVVALQRGFPRTDESPRQPFGSFRAMRMNMTVSPRRRRLSVTDDDLTEVGKLTSLRQLELTKAAITDAGLAHLQRLDALHRLDLSGTRITDAGLAHLARMTELDTLILDGTKITDGGLAHLKPLTRLSTLRLARTEVTDAGLAHLARMTELDTLILDGTKITDGGLAHQRSLNKLFDSRLVWRKVTDAGLPHLAGMVQLRTLSLHNTRVSDTGLVHLYGLTRLKELDLRKTWITGEGLRELEKALPGVNISVGHMMARAWRHRAPWYVINDNYEMTVLDFSHLQANHAEFEAVKVLHNIHELDLRVTHLPFIRINVTDATLAHLKGLVHLEELNLAFQTGISDAGLKHLAGMRNLKLLNLVGTRVTGDGVRQLQRALPQTEIIR